MFGQKESKTKDLMHDHLEAVNKCLESFADLIHAHLDRKDNVEELAKEVNRLEAEADGYRRDVEAKIYQGAFVPVFREDYITLVEIIDGIANRAETISDIIVQQSPDVPEGHRNSLKKLTDKVLECYQPLSDIISVMDRSWEKGHKLAQQVEELEQEADKIEWNLIKEIFDRDDLTLAEKLQLRDLVQYIASISDRMEDSSDRVDIMLIKRKA